MNTQAKAGGPNPGNKLPEIRAFLRHQTNHPAWVKRSDEMWTDIDGWEVGDWQDLYQELQAMSYPSFDRYVLDMITFADVRDFIKREQA